MDGGLEVYAPEEVVQKGDDDNAAFRSGTSISFDN